MLRCTRRIFGKTYKTGKKYTEETVVPYLRGDIPDVTQTLHGPPSDEAQKDMHPLWGGHKGDEPWKFQWHVKDDDLQLEPEANGRKLKPLFENRFVQWCCENLPMDKPLHEVSNEDLYNIAKHAWGSMGRRYPGGEGLGFDIEDILELLHDPNIASDEVWHSLQEFFQMPGMREALEEHFDPVSLFLPPEISYKLKVSEIDATANNPDRKDVLVGRAWEELQPLLSEEHKLEKKQEVALEMLELHRKDPMAWSYERLSAAFGTDSQTVKKLLLWAGNRGSSMYGYDFRYSEAEEHLARKRDAKLREKLPPIDQAEHTRVARENSFDRHYPDFYDSHTVAVNAMKELVQQEPTIMDLHEKVVPMGPDPQYAQEDDWKTEAERRAFEMPDLAPLERSSVPNILEGKIEPDHPPANISFQYYEEGFYNNLMSERADENSYHLIRQRDGVLRHATKEERESLSMYNPQWRIEPAEIWARRALKRKLMDRIEQLDPFNPLAPGTLGLSPYIKDKGMIDGKLGNIHKKDIYDLGLEGKLTVKHGFTPPFEKGGMDH